MILLMPRAGGNTTRRPAISFVLTMDDSAAAVRFAGAARPMIAEPGGCARPGRRANPITRSPLTGLQMDAPSSIAAGGTGKPMTRRSICSRWGCVARCWESMGTGHRSPVEFGRRLPKNFVEIILHRLPQKTPLWKV